MRRRRSPGFSRSPTSLKALLRCHATVCKFACQNIVGDPQVGWSIRADPPIRPHASPHPRLLAHFPHSCSFFDVRRELLAFS
jgi:hypothetical protein